VRPFLLLLGKKKPIAEPVTWVNNGANEPIINRNVETPHSQVRHHAGKIWKPSFVSTVRPNVHTNPSRKRSFSKNALQTGRIWKRWLFVFVWTETILKMDLFYYDIVTRDNHAVKHWLIEWLIDRASSITNPKGPVNGAFFKFLRRSVDGNIWCAFRVKPPFSNSSGVVWNFHWNV